MPLLRPHSRPQSSSVLRENAETIADKIWKNTTNVISEVFDELVSFLLRQYLGLIRVLKLTLLLYTNTPKPVHHFLTHPVIVASKSTRGRWTRCLSRVFTRTSLSLWTSTTLIYKLACFDDNWWCRLSTVSAKEKRSISKCQFVVTTYANL